MKFSIIIPIYNVEKYLDKCLNSVINQSYKNFEAILVCDKSTDSSNKIVDKYIKKDNRLIKIYEENTGLSKAKNIGVSNAKGDIIIFVDGDDYIEKDLLERLNIEKSNEYDLIRFQAREINENLAIDYKEEQFDGQNGIEAFNKIANFHYIENSWLYAYNLNFFKSNDFKFCEGCIAEDYGLTPLIIAKAKKVKSISYIGYNYVQRKNSLMNNKNYNKKIKKMDDMLQQASYLKLELKNIEKSNKIINFLDDSLIYYSTTLKYKDFNKYNKILKKRGCFNHLNGKTFRNKIRCNLIKFNSYIFFNFINKVI